MREDPGGSSGQSVAQGWHGHCVSSGYQFARERTAMFGIGIVGLIILIIVILWLLGYIG